jgi:SAM-dependent methyltransferase
MPKPEGRTELASTQDILKQIASYYASKLAAHGATARGVDWNGEQSQTQRHRQFLRLLDADRNASVLDLGCGYGDFLRFLRAEGYAGTYTGCDVAKDMINAARSLHGEGSDRLWRVGSAPDESAHYAIASGIFNVKGAVSTEEWTGHVRQTIEVLAQAGRRGFGFNMLTKSGDPALRRPDLYYADPADMMTHCIGRYGPSVALLQDYGLWEFTLLVRRAG